MANQSNKVPATLAARVKLLLTEDNAPLITRFREVGELMNLYHDKSQGWFEVDNENLDSLLDIFADLVAWIKANGDKQRQLPSH